MLSEKELAAFECYLRDEEKSPFTIEKYLRDARAFVLFCGERELNKELVLSYKQKLTDSGTYAVGSINSMLSSVNSFLSFLKQGDCRVRLLKTQKQIYCSGEKELTKEDYLKLLEASRENQRLWMLLQTICSTGIRVSELRYFTYESIQQGEITVRCKNKIRTILIPAKLRKLLQKYCKEQKISAGVIFRTKSGRALDRSNIWSMMKALCAKAKVAASKVFPHNLRKLFARIFYKAQHDIATLADVLGHSSINTTRIYIMVSCREHQQKIDKMDLVV